MRSRAASLVIASLLSLSTVARGQAPPPAGSAPPVGAAPPVALPPAPPTEPVPLPPAAAPPVAYPPIAPVPAPYGATPSYYGAAPLYAPAKKRRSLGMMIAGIAMAGLGGVGAVAGSVEYVAAPSFCNAFSSRSFNRDSCLNLYRDLGISEMILGGVLVAVGIPLAVVGAGKPPTASTAFLPSLEVGRSHAALAWSF